jgi:polyvinyl alcohol dehydrogenase (cytochrome)
VQVGGAVTGTPAVVDGRVVFGSWDRHVHAVDARTGERRWTFDTRGGVDASPAIVDGFVYIGDSAGWLYKLALTDGKEAWSVLLDPEPATHVYSSPLVHQGVVYLGVASDQESVRLYPEGELTFHGSVVAVAADSGRILWRTYVQRPGEDGAGGSVWSSVVLDPATMTVYATTGNAYTAPDGPYVEAMLALDAGSGDLDWAFKANSGDVWTQREPHNPDWDFGSSAIVWQGGGQKLVVAAQKSSAIYARDATTGEAVWQWGKPQSGDGVIASPAVMDGTLFVPFVGQQTVRAIALADGKLRWERPVGAAVYSAPAAVPGVLFVGVTDGRLLALDAATGAVLAEEATGHGGIFGGISVAGGRIYAGTVPKGFLGKEGYLVAWGPS